MEITFVANARILGYKPGQIIKTEMTTQLHALLAIGRHLTLIDPPTLAEVYAGPQEVVEPTPSVEVKENGSRKGANNTKERRPFSFTDNG